MITTHFSPKVGLLLLANGILSIMPDEAGAVFHDDNALSLALRAALHPRLSSRRKSAANARADFLKFLADATNLSNTDEHMTNFCPNPKLQLMAFQRRIPTLCKPSSDIEQADDEPTKTRMFHQRGDLVLRHGGVSIRFETPP
ncbi:hypothetical protein N8E89_25895 (plasmid) [Phyllobacterium sp. A18/5-2]|uniref:hypothetical protein n=1 Tax=Phyllobacterium sp. A18/5-2 TaxID=2978392 RepID=UPI0021CACD3F|nr:hypothetical protein [Phyllobacterium sp. A18/5-2]UXN66532.1 hypothetical protein N8E89_25895 [Phyllobacterium sp. A18/5-2]